MAAGGSEFGLVSGLVAVMFQMSKGIKGSRQTEQQSSQMSVVLGSVFRYLEMRQNMFIDNGEGLYNLGLMINRKIRSFVDNHFSGQRSNKA